MRKAFREKKKNNNNNNLGATNYTIDLEHVHYIKLHTLDYPPYVEPQTTEAQPRAYVNQASI